MDLDDLYRTLRGAHVQAQGVVDTIRDPLLVTDENLCILSANPAFYRTFDTCRDDTLGKCLPALGDGQWDIPELKFLIERVIRKASAVMDYEVTTAFPTIGPRTMLVTAQRLEHPEDGRRLLLVSFVDATEQRTKDVEKDMLVGEVQHRIKNLLALTQSLAKQTKVEGRSAEEYRDALLARLGALGRSLQSSLSGSAIDLKTLTEAVLEPYIGTTKRIEINGSDVVPLQSQHATALGMIFHELATNASKYGALSSSSGKVLLDWRVQHESDGSARTELTWMEHGGPAPDAAHRIGFGKRLITASAERELGGTVELDFRATGLTAKIVFPIT